MLGVGVKFACLKYENQIEDMNHYFYIVISYSNLMFDNVTPSWLNFIYTDDISNTNIYFYIIHGSFVLAVYPILRQDLYIRSLFTSFLSLS